jgi:hypothetical protein
MYKIHFIHPYKKLGSLIHPFKARLLQVIKIDLKDLSEEFRSYDTDSGLYKLPDAGPYILLIFSKVCDTPPFIFTTCRAYTSEKLKFYQSSTGRTFDVLV